MRLAADLARRFNAALIGISAWAPSPAFSGDIALIEPVPDVADLRTLEEVLKGRGEAFYALAKTAAGAVEWRSALELPTEFVAREARAADLLIVGAGRHAIMRDPYRAVDPGALLLRAGRPVLLVPPEAAALSGRHIAAAWKDTKEARRAIVDALPLLARAETVTVVEFCDDRDEAAAQAHLEDVKRFLARHEISAAARAIRIDVSVTSSLWRLVQDDRVDLIVAGGYGHSRLGEWIFGGLTRDLLLKSPVPCLLSH
ncbi:MAG TPA: universal stress protein [Xanthobacteraceae bacterium]|nr:universal stress protein [Xanthobacteraceae bacterium]